MNDEILYREELVVLRHLVTQELRLHVADYSAEQRAELQDLSMKLQCMIDVAPSGLTPKGAA